MEDIIRNLLSGAMTVEDKTSRLREFLQVLILRDIYTRGFFRNISFVGGTALRFLYGLRRFSEDLDFSLFYRKGYDFDELCASLKRGLEHSGFAIDADGNNRRTVQSIDVKFKNLLYPYGLSPIKAHKLTIRVEIDANPPPGWKTQVSIINQTYIFTVTHFDLPSLYALKLHACFYRKYTKGRDFYDLIWYLTRKQEPNFSLLNNAVKQTEGINPRVNAANFKEFLAGNLVRIDFRDVKKDITRFLEDKTELKLFNRKLILNIL